ncbi:N-acetylmuramoyl-L-alanine amidase [Fibrobacter sp.]|uniref:N-acetylmuramoyl-L-alanine amidase n=1 Tax=Fibrobacter sp. TaxID=35828 RepID=UPI0026029AAB|nr:N-acetylmuramoyl-L-alanine amidase [Fibrobacter sp.]MDD5943278.1 N-acetylmuramoyl-L-alanine amidase [Fibrobacter sp.]
MTSQEVRLGLDEQFAKEIEGKTNKNYEQQGADEAIPNSAFVIRSICCTKKKLGDADFQKKRARKYFEGYRKPEDYEYFIERYHLSITLFDKLKDEKKDVYANKIVKGSTFAQLKNNEINKAKVDIRQRNTGKAMIAYYKSKVSIFAENCYNNIQDYNGAGESSNTAGSAFHHYVSETNKKGICLHYTAGSSVKGDLDTLFQKYREAVHYVVGRDGSIYRLFADELYSGHLGSFEDKKNDNKESVNGNLKKFNAVVTGNKSSSLHDCSISIEISNLGYLVDDTVEEKSGGKEKPFGIQEDKFQLDKSKKGYNYRKYGYYEALTDIQMNAVCALVNYLITNPRKKECLKIPDVWRVDSYNDNRAIEYADQYFNEKGSMKKEDYIQEYYDYGSKFSSEGEANRFSGVFTHTDYRFGKSDFPTEIMQKIRERYKMLYKYHFDESKYNKNLIAYMAVRYKELQDKGYPEERISQYLCKQFVEKECLSEEDFFSKDSDVSYSCGN